MKNIIGVQNPYELIQTAGKRKSRKGRKARKGRKSRKSRNDRKFA